MTGLVPLIRAVIREELAGRMNLELGVVTQVASNQGGAGDANIDVNLRLRGSSLELQRVPVAVARLGLSAAPREGDLAAVGFVDGDLNGPVVLGFLYSDATPAPDAGPEEIVYRVPDAADDAARRVEIALPNGNTVTILDAAVTIAMGSSSVTVEADGNITLEAGADLVLKAGGGVAIESGTALSIKGASVTSEASGAATLKGGAVSIAGTTSFSAA